MNYTNPAQEGLKILPARYNGREVSAKKFFRGVSLYLLGTGLVFLLFLLAYMMVFTQVTAKPEQVKRILRDSGVYQKIPGVVYDDAVGSDSTSSQSIPLKDSAVRQAALDTFDGSFIQKSVETAIDGTYGWLRGYTSQPKFNIDLRDAKDRFAQSLSSHTEDRLQGLPICTAAQLQKIKEIDPLNIPCRPPGINIKAQAQKVLADAKNSENFLKDTTIDPKTFKDSEGKPVFDNYSDVPEAYQTTLKLPYVIAALCLVLAAGIVFLSERRSSGFKKLGKILLLGGIFVIVAPIGIGYISGAFLKSAPDDKILTELVAPVVTELNKATSRVYFITGIIYILLACAAFYAYHKTREPTAAKPTGGPKKEQKG